MTSLPLEARGRRTAHNEPWTLTLGSLAPRPPRSKGDDYVVLQCPLDVLAMLVLQALAPRAFACLIILLLMLGTWYIPPTLLLFLWFVNHANTFLYPTFNRPWKSEIRRSCWIKKNAYPVAPFLPRYIIYSVDGYNLTWRLQEQYGVCRLRQRMATGA